MGLRCAGSVLRHERGASAIEMAIALPLLIALIGGIFDFGRYYWIRNSMQLATEETGRYVMITGTTTQSTVQTYLQGKVQAVPSAQVTVNVTPQAGTPSYLTITATYSFSSIFGNFVGLLANRTLTTRVKVPIVS
jgi:Flp pilus assembly protein TadG